MSIYSVNKIPESTNSTKKYHFIKGMDGIIDLCENYWYLKLYLYSCNNFYLPPNSLLANLKLPYQTIKGIAFNLSSDQDRKNKYKWEEEKYCKVYEAICTIDISGNKYLGQNLCDTKINYQFNFEIDPEPISRISNNSIDQYDLDSLINETYGLEWDFNVYYSNIYQMTTNNLVCDCRNLYKIDTNKKITEEKSVVKAIVNDYMNCQKPIIKLATIKSTVPFQITNIVIKFFYRIDGNNNEYEFELKNFKSNPIGYEAEINCDFKTLFNEKSNLITNSFHGIKGFYIPKFSSGLYQVNFNLLQNNNNVKFVVTNPFHFATRNNFPKIKIINAKFENLNTFTNWIIND